MSKVKTKSNDNFYETIRLHRDADRVFRLANPSPPQKLDAAGRVVATWDERQEQQAHWDLMVAHRQTYADALRKPVKKVAAPAAASPPAATAYQNQMAAFNAQMAAKTSELTSLLTAIASPQDRPFVAAWAGNEANCWSEFPEFALYAAYQRHAAR